jgi:hypothetical protein
MDNGLGILTNSEEEQIDFVVCCISQTFIYVFSSFPRIEMRNKLYIFLRVCVKSSLSSVLCFLYF